MTTHTTGPVTWYATGAPLQPSNPEPVQVPTYPHQPIQVPDPTLPPDPDRSPIGPTDPPPEVPIPQV